MHGCEHMRRGCNLQERFGAFTIGLQIRRRKCNGAEGEISCDAKPSVEHFCDIARSHGP